MNKYLVEFSIVERDIDTILYNRACRAFVAFTDNGLLFIAEDMHELQESIKQTLIAFQSYVDVPPVVSQLELDSFNVDIFQLCGINNLVSNLISISDINVDDSKTICKNFNLARINTI